MHERLARLSQDADPQEVLAIAELWSDQVRRIISLMLKLWREEDGGVLSTRARHEAILELANLTLWLERKVIDKNLEGRSLDRVRVSEERVRLSAPDAEERIENTARMLLDRVWGRRVAQWRQRFPLLGHEAESDGTKVSRLRGAPEPGVKDNHYSPSFSNRFWASGAANRFREYRRGIGLDIRSRVVGYRTWGKESFLYSPRLERLLSLIDGDGAGPYRSILDHRPLGELDRRRWIAFLLVQLLRTPSFHLKQLRCTREFLNEGQVDFPTTIGAMRQAYETLFTNNTLFAWFYRTLDARAWQLLSASPGSFFLRADEPAVIAGSMAAGSWRLLYPMTPSHCFSVGPAPRPSEAPEIVRVMSLNASDVDEINRVCARNARRTVIAPIVPDDEALVRLLAGAMSMIPSREDWLAAEGFEFWGGLD